MNRCLARLVMVMGPAFFINEKIGFAFAMVWAVACWMILLAVSRSAWARR